MLRQPTTDQFDFRRFRRWSAAKRRRGVRLRFSLRSLMVLTTAAAVLTSYLNWLLESQWRVLPLCALLPPFAAVCLMLALTNYETRLGFLLGTLSGIGILAVFSQDSYLNGLHFFHLLHTPAGWWASRTPYWGLVYEWQLVVLFGTIAAMAVFGGCLQAIRRGYALLSLVTALLTAVYYFGLFAGFVYEWHRRLC